MTTLAQYSREQKARYVAEREEQAHKKTRELEAFVSLLQTVLRRTLESPSYALEFASLLKPDAYPKFDAQGFDEPEPAPLVDEFLPPTPSILVRWVPALKARYDDAVREAELAYKAAFETWTARENKRRAALEKLQQNYRAACDEIDIRNTAERDRIAAFEKSCKALEPAATAQYFSKVIARYEPVTGALANRIAYVQDSRHLVVEVELPSVDVLPDVAQYRYIRKSDEIVPVRRTASGIKSLYASLLAQIALGVLHVAFTSDRNNAIGTLTVSGFVDTIDPATGKPTRPCLLSVRCSKDLFETLDLKNVDSAACLKGLHAQVSRSAHELEPVKPLVDFNMVDPRFIDKSDVLSGLDSRPNLADLTPSEFETLMTNLFEKMGLETKLTRSSRDGGVDCVAWDMRPIIGGKVVIQAKRYRHTVGVSAVRDLYGTLMNEGAAKGILVTTSGYGKSAFEFASNKPIELITGSNLLYLLKEHANVDAKIEFPDDWVDPIEQGA